jgi:hypothetical protein
LFRLGLEPPAWTRIRVVRPEPEPLPGPDVPLTTEELEEAFRDGYLWSWSAQRLALAVLAAHGGRMAGARVVEIMRGYTTDHSMRVSSADYWRSGAILVSEAGLWAVNPEHDTLPAARYDLKREAVQEDGILEVVLGHAPGWSDPCSRVRRCQVVVGRDRWELRLVSEDGEWIDEWEVQIARRPGATPPRTPWAR